MKMMLYGAERYFLEIQAHQIINKHARFAQGVKPVVYDCEGITFTWDQLFEELMTVSFFEPVKVIYCYNPVATLKNLSDAQFKMFSDIIENLPEEVVFFLMVESPSYDQRLKIFKLFTKTKHFQKVADLNDASFQRLVIKTLKENDLELQPNLLNLLIKRLPMQVPTIQQEIAKLASYPLSITPEVIKSLISRPMADNVFDLSKAIMLKDHNNAWRVYQDLLVLKHDPVSLIPAIAWQYRIMFHILHYKSKNLSHNDIKQTMNEHSFAFDKAWDYANHTSKDSVMVLLDQLAVLDQSIKMGKTDKKMGFERFLLEAMR
jgi:DNA polymerase-3 subunit delta